MPGALCGPRWSSEAGCFVGLHALCGMQGGAVDTGRVVVALRQVYEVESEIPPAVREYFVERDGRWTLVVDPPIEDVSGLKNALADARNVRRETEKTLSEMKVKFEGIDPDEFHKLKERVKGLDDADIYDKQGIEALVVRRTESMKADHERQLSSVKRENEQLRGNVTDLDRRWRQDRIKTALFSAVAESGVEKPAYEDAVHRGMTVFNDLDADGNVVSKKGEDTAIGKDGFTPLTPQEWIANLKASGTARHLWPPSGGSGAPAHHGGNGTGVDWNAIKDPVERLTAYRAAMGQGTQR